MVCDNESTNDEKREEQSLKCDDPQCYNYNTTSPMYCDECIKKEIDKMTYEEVSDM